MYAAHRWTGHYWKDRLHLWSTGYRERCRWAALEQGCEKLGRGQRGDRVPGRVERVVRGSPGRLGGMVMGSRGRWGTC